MKSAIPFILMPLLSLPAAAAVSMTWIAVGDTGNAPDPLTGYGSVAREYLIGKHEVTIGQYATFLNATAKSDPYGLYDTLMPSFGITRGGSSGSYTYDVTAGKEPFPVVRVTWFDAARFANWMANGQGDGATETGSYTLNGAMSGIINANPGALIHLPSEDEWYKAAYYNDSGSAYSIYPNGRNTITKQEANYGEYFGVVKAVGSYPSSPSAYGTLDQGGNVFELTDGTSGGSRVIRGGNWFESELYLRSATRLAYPATGMTDNVGFRLAAVPEPSISVLVLLSGTGLLTRRARR